MSNLKHATQDLYEVVYLKAGESGLTHFSLHQAKNNCWPDIRTLRAQGFAAWAAKIEAVLGDDLGEALDERGLV